MGRTVGCGTCGEPYDSDWFCTRCGPHPSAGAVRCERCQRYYLPELSPDCSRCGPAPAEGGQA